MSKTIEIIFNPIITFGNTLLKGKSNLGQMKNLKATSIMGQREYKISKKITFN